MITVDPASPLAPSEQIRSQLEDQIRFGTLEAGYRLPAIRQLAADLRVAAGTVAKAYAALEEEGLLETSRSRGTRVAVDATYAPRVKRAAVAYVDALKGIDLEQALSAVRAAWRAHGVI